MLGNRALATPGANGRDSSAQTLLDGTVGTGSELDQRVQWDLELLVTTDNLMKPNPKSTHSHPR